MPRPDTPSLHRLERPAASWGVHAPWRSRSRSPGSSRYLRIRVRLFPWVGWTLAWMAGAALAQEGVPEVQYKKKTVINFEDDTIEGDLKTPDGQYLEVRARMRHRSLIRIRTNFRREVLGSIADL